MDSQRKIRNGSVPSGSNAERVVIIANEAKKMQAKGDFWYRTINKIGTN